MVRQDEGISGRYRLLAQIGTSAIGVVYRAVDAATGDELSVTVVERSLASDRVSREQLQRLVQNLTRLQSPRIARVRELTATEHGLFLLAEPAEGESLAACLARIGKLSTTDALLITREIAAALEDAGRQGVVHGGLTPEHVRITGGAVKVSGFGLAGLSRAAIDVKTRLRQAEYRAPERFSDSGDARADVYSLGIMLYQMITGGVPFKGGTVEALYQLHAFTPVPPLPGGLPAGLYQLVARCLAKQPQKRYQSPSGLAGTLRQLLLPGAAHGTRLSESVSAAVRHAPAEEPRTIAATAVPHALTGGSPDNREPAVGGEIADSSGTPSPETAPAAADAAGGRGSGRAGRTDPGPGGRAAAGGRRRGNRAGAPGASPVG